MFSRIVALLFGPARSQPSADVVMRRRSEALARVEAAYKRGDSRDYGRALMLARQATVDALRVELRR